MSKVCTEKNWALQTYAEPKYLSKLTWKEVCSDGQSFYLSIVYPRLLILHKGTTINTFDLSGACEKIEITYCNDIIGIKTVDNSGKIPRCRVRLARGHGNKTSYDNCLEVVGELKRFVPVTQHLSRTTKEPKVSGCGIQTSYNNCLKEAGELDKFVQVTQHSSHFEKEPKGTFVPRKLALHEILKDMPFSENSNYTENVESTIPESYMKDIIREFVLHPEFPAKVVSMWEMLEKISRNEHQ